MTPTVLIFKRDLLPYSETFIREQADALSGFSPVYVGLRYTPGLELPPDKVIVVNDGTPVGWAREGAHRWLHPDAGVIARLRDLHPVLMHAHFENGGIAAHQLARSLGIPLITTCHGSDVTTADRFSHPNPLLRALYSNRLKSLQADGQRFLAVSEFIRSEMIARGYPADRIDLHYVGVDVAKFQATPDVPREDVVLHVGRLVEKKGCRYLIEAMAKVQRTKPDLEMVVIGDGPLRGALEEQARSCLTSYRFLGVRSPEEVRYCMNRARVLAVPSITTDHGGSEGLPIVALEALSMGLPVVGFDHAGIAEAVKSDCLSAEKDVDALAARIEATVDRTDRWQALSDAGRQTAVNRFSLTSQIQRLEAIYHKVVAEFGAGAAA